MFYDKTSEWRTQKMRTRIPRHVARKTMKHCEGCNCPGFPYCFKRVFPKIKINQESAESGTFCQYCACSSCPSKKEQGWTYCYLCREYYLSHLHCRCHSWWIMDYVPFYLSKYDSRVYDGNYDDDDVIRECDVCQAKLFPYNQRQPCSFERHHASHEHFNEKRITKKSQPSRLHFCYKCQQVKNFQCGFCSNKFPSAKSADRHIISKHKELITTEQKDTKCAICEDKEKWDRLKRRYGLQKWIQQRLKFYESVVPVFKNEEVVHIDVDEKVPDESEDYHQMSFGDAVKKCT